MSAGQQYRRDIDGLRALAILPVLLFHTHVPGFSGGFVGVDVFFVISGYLITGIIAREIDAGQFSLVRFYERRARRILPALLAMLAFVLAMASWLYLPGDFEAVPKSALMALGFLSNLWFFTSTGYFAGGAETMPLLHCWSLAVEEQFYIGFPLLLWGIARWCPRWRVGAIAGAAAVSLGWAMLKAADSDGFAFYMLPPRAWELFAGSLLAVGALPDARPRWLREALAGTGLALIFYAVFTYSAATVFPGISAIPPVLGAALLIHAAPGTGVGRLLSSPVPVGIGLISYSLYLWHWPLIVFAEYARDEKLSGVWQLGVIAASVLAAWASWRWIERPFRSSQDFGQKRIFVWSGLGMAAIAIGAAALVPLGGWPGRFPAEVAHFTAAKSDFSPKRADCLSDAIGGLRPECTLGARGAAPTALLWGDSHGVEFAWLLGQEYAAKGQALIQRTRGSCPPLAGFDRAKDPGCAAFNADVLALLGKSPSITTVYLSALWAQGEYRDDPGALARLDATIAAVTALGKRVVVIGPVPPQPWNVPRHLAHAAAFGTADQAIGAPLSDYQRDTRWLTGAYPRWLAAGVRVIDPARALIDGKHSRIVKDGVPLYFDSHHLSLAGARAVLAADPRR
ncbi:MAG: acyltransferase family protein [Novosphingobium sp.]|uniref:acyltransferase family protein n=1 Tax=Novosphingobium sp. TaxID=1874826 RepID=UPI0032B952C9